MEGFDITTREILRAICDNEKLKYCTIHLEPNIKEKNFRLHVRRKECSVSGLGYLDREMIIKDNSQLDHIKMIFDESKR